MLVDFKGRSVQGHYMLGIAARALDVDRNGRMKGMG